MKNALMILMFVGCSMPGMAQKVKKAIDKGATKVDSINTPPRMDGNTGQYDTVRNANSAEQQTSGSTQKVEYNYQLHTDSVRVQKAPAGK